MGIFTYIKIGIIAVLVIACSYLVWNYQHMKTKIAGLEQQVVELKLKADIIEKAQKATDAFLAKKTLVQRKVTSEKTEIDQTVQAGDNAHLRELFINHGLLQPKSNPAPGRAKSGP